MEYPELGDAVHPINTCFEKVAGPGMRVCGIQPERLVYTYQVPPEREAKFEVMVNRLLAAVSSFEFKSPLYACVSKSAQLRDGVLSWDEWSLQFQVNEHGRSDDQIIDQVYSQANEILQEIEEYLYA